MGYKYKGIGVIKVAGYLAEVGDVRRFESPRQIQKPAGLFNAAIPLIAKNPEFKSLHKYYTTRANNPLKEKQSVIVISCKRLGCREIKRLNLSEELYMMISNAQAWQTMINA